LIVRISAVLSRRLRVALLMLLGIVSLVTGTLPVIGLIALLWGIGLLVVGRFQVSETAQVA
jgi:hypothetical protein